ncbi:hypothetical protein A2U01_0110965, partial [Trifolium medium]|nr:hypothetical protein [Trifolium medium]
DTADIGTVAATPKRKWAGKEKIEKVVEGKKKSTKKPRTQKKRAPKVVRQLMIQEEDEEETDEEPLQSKRK